MLKEKVQQRIVNFVLRLARPTTTFNPKLSLHFSDLQFILPSNKKLDLCFIHPIFRFWFLVTFGNEVTKILFNLCLQFARQDGQDGKNPERKSRN